MQLHTSVLNFTGIYLAARIARVDVVELDESGSRTAARKYVVHLEGESRRAPNRRGKSSGKAATWDQWGVFLGVLYDIDPDMVCGPSLKGAYYRDANHFHNRTNDRFRATDVAPDLTIRQWPADAHGDHRFMYDGTVGEQKCTKCTAVQRWT